MSFSNLEIEQGIIEGKKEVFAWLWQEVGHPIQSHVLSNSGTKEDAAVLFRMSIMTVRKKIMDNTYQDNNNITGYIYGVARNHWKEQLRKMKKRQEKETTLTDKENWVADPDQTEEEKIIFQSDIKMLHLALKKLGEQCRQLFQMHYFDGLSFVEISEELDTNDSTIRKRHYDCKNKLKKLFFKS